MRRLAALALIAQLAVPLLGHATDAPRPDGARSDSDCTALLERWANDPKAAPKRVIDTCKAQLASAAPAAAAPVEEPARLASVDPCSGPDAANSVLCWGPWASLAPAAAGPLVTLKLPDNGIECDSGQGLSEPCVAKLEPDLPLEGCTPGTPCGFATVVSGVTSTGDPVNTQFAKFNLAPDGTQFSVAPEGGDQIHSVPMTTIVTGRDDGYGNLRARGQEGDVQSRLIARVVQNDDGEVLLAADVWTHGTHDNAQSGYFAWGTTTSQGSLDSLNAGNVSLNFTGPMSVNNATTGSMTVNFGSNPTWTGTWTNPSYNFGAGGVVTVANLISQPDKFSNNVVGTGNFVQGALVGEPGARGITHVIDVTLEGQGRIKDVGLLRDVIASPVIAP